MRAESGWNRGKLENISQRYRIFSNKHSTNRREPLMKGTSRDLKVRVVKPSL